MTAAAEARVAIPGLCFQSGFLHAAVDVADRILITGDDVESWLPLYPPVPDGIGDVLKIVDGEFLRDHINDLVAGRYIGTVLIGDQAVDLFLADLLFQILAYNISACLQTLI